MTAVDERSGGVLNRTQYPSEVTTLVVLWRSRYRRTLQDLTEMFLQRGIVFSHETVHEWEANRDMAAAKACFRSAKSATGLVPDRVTTDGHGSCLRAIRFNAGPTRRAPVV